MVLYILLYLLFLYIPTRHAFMMFQQNRYRYDRYHVWLKQTIIHKRITILSIAAILMLCYFLFLLPNGQGPQYFLAALLLIFIYVSYKWEQQQVYRKPLQITNRIKRLMAASYALYFIVFFVLFYCTSIWIWVLLTPVIYFMPWIMVMASGALMIPIEHLIQKMYVKEAQRLLQEAKDLSIIGITGSYGKTSVKHILNEMVQDEWLTLMTPKSYNNAMGITLTIRRYLKPLHEIFLCEMGADHVNEIRDLMDFVKPRIGVVTAVGPQHLQTFRSMEAILHEKMQMIEKLPINGIGFINADNTYIRSWSIKNTCRIIRFGKDMNADYHITNISYTKEGTTFDIIHQQERHSIYTKLLGEHNVMNITCSIAVAHTLGVSWEKLLRASANLPYVEHRLQKIDSNSYTILDDAYNANPSGSRYALEVLRQMEGKRFLVTPGFIDLGERQEIENYQLGRDIIGCCDEVVLVGKNQTHAIAKGLKEAGFPMAQMHVVTSMEQAFHFLYDHALPEDVVLIENDLPDAFNR